MDEGAGGDDTRVQNLECRLQAAEAALRSAADALAARDAFIGAISRELRNPLAPVTLAVERLRAAAGSADADRIGKSVDMIERACAVFESRTRALLDFVELTGRTPALARVPVNVSELVRASATRHADVARRAGCALQLDIAPGIVRPADAQAVAQVLDHLLSNAFRFGAGRPVRVGLREIPGGGATVRICDEGPGVRPDQADSIFDLVRHPRPHDAPGFGIGLWIGRRLAHAMGATLALDLTRISGVDDEAGACFELGFPAQANHAR